MKHNYDKFIEEQKVFFQQELLDGFTHNWEDQLWLSGRQGTGWLRARGSVSSFNFQEIKKIKGVESQPVNTQYQYFLKAMLVLSYRRSNKKASPQKLYAEFLVLRRWYASLSKNGLQHPTDLSTSHLTESFDILKENISSNNLADYAGTYIRLQQLINNYAFTSTPLEFNEKHIYMGSANRTIKSKKTLKLISQEQLNDDEIEDDKLISIKTFTNVISLIKLCETEGEKILLNLLLLLIITGFRATEVFFLEIDSLVEKPVLDPNTGEHLLVAGKKQYVVGIRYYGAKKAGERIHWLEPSTVPLVKSIFKNVIELTKAPREYLKYIRQKNTEKITDFLPKAVDDFKGDTLEIEDFIDTVFSMQKNYSSRGGQRDAVSKLLKNLDLPFVKSKKKSNKLFKYYTKHDINQYIKNTYHKKSSFLHLIDIVFELDGKPKSIPFENLLFIHFYLSTNISRSLIHKACALPLNTRIVNAFLGSSKNVSIFKKYDLKDSNNSFSKLTTHIPRHNINTFLALSGLSEHLQAILMGRVDIKQNQYYQHLALKQTRLAAGLTGKIRFDLFEDNITSPTSIISSINSIEKINKDFEFDSQINDINSPVSQIKKDGVLFCSKDNSFYENLKSNLHSFDNQKERSQFIKSTDSFFNDITESFNQLKEKDNDDANEMVERHAYLHPLRFGSCMRNVGLHDCPIRLSCLSGKPCGNFTLTGRRGELEAIVRTKNQLMNELAIIRNELSDNLQYKDMIDQMSMQIKNLDLIEQKSKNQIERMRPIIVFPYLDNLNKVPETLSEVFALEQLKLDNEE